jgi:hypothetical protein
VSAEVSLLAPRIESLRCEGSLSSNSQSQAPSQTASSTVRVLFALPGVPLLCRFSDAGNDDLTTRCGGRRPKTAKARNRVGG